MYCANCGKLNQEDSKFCGYCGKPLDKERAPASRHKDNFMNGEGLRASFLKTVLLFITLMWLIETCLCLWFTGTTKKLYYSLARFIIYVVSDSEITFIEGFRQVMMFLRGQNAIGKVIFLMDWSFSVINALLIIMAVWRIFKKAGRHGWEGLIPIYNFFCALIVIFGDQWGKYLLFYIGFIVLEFFLSAALGLNVFTIIILYILGLGIVLKLGITISRRFGHGWGYAILQLFIPLLFILIYGWGKDQYHEEIEGL